MSEQKKIDLAKETCETCNRDMPPMTMPDAMKLLRSLHEAWSINAGGRLERAFLTKDFAKSLKLGLYLGQVAEEAHHYPELIISNGLLRVEIWTRAINGLCRSDFVLAAKLDASILGAARDYV